MKCPTWKGYVSQNNRDLQQNCPKCKSVLFVQEWEEEKVEGFSGESRCDNALAQTPVRSLWR